MKKGTVRWFDKNKGYGFIAPDDGSKDVFVHITALEQGKISQLSEGQKINFELATNKGRQSAVNLQLLHGNQ